MPKGLESEPINQRLKIGDQVILLDFFQTDLWRAGPLSPEYHYEINRNGGKAKQIKALEKNIGTIGTIQKTDSYHDGVYSCGDAMLKDKSGYRLNFGFSNRISDVVFPLEMPDDDIKTQVRTSGIRILSSIRDREERVSVNTDDEESFNIEIVRNPYREEDSNHKRALVSTIYYPVTFIGARGGVTHRLIPAFLLKKIGASTLIGKQ